MRAFNLVHNEDCLDGLGDVAPGSFDAIVTSPPYFAPPYYMQEGLGETSGEYLQNVSDRLAMAMKKLKPSGVLFLNHADVQPIRMPWRIVDALTQRGGCYLGEFVWSLSPNEHESIYVLTASPAPRRHLGRVSGVWDLGPNPGELRFPEGLVERCLKFLRLPTGCVLDPFMGFGTTGIVAKRLGWTYMGFEKMPETCEEAIRRIAAA